MAKNNKNFQYRILHKLKTDTLFVFWIIFATHIELIVISKMQIENFDYASNFNFHDCLRKNIFLGSLEVLKI